MKNAKFILSLGVVLAITTSVQVKGMEGVDNSKLNPDQKQRIAQYQKALNNSITSLNKEMSLYEYDLLTSAETKKFNAETLKGYEDQLKKLETISKDTVPYTDAEIKFVYDHQKNPAKNPYLTQKQVKAIERDQRYINEDIEIYNKEKQKHQDLIRTLNKQYIELEMILNRNQRYTMEEINAVAGVRK